MRGTLLVSALAIAWCASGCGAPSRDVNGFGKASSVTFDAREGSVVVEGCQLDTWQTAQLVSEPAHRAIKTVILLCPTIHPSGEVIPTDLDALGRLKQTIGNVRAMGYAVRLAVGIADDTDVPLSGARDALLFADAAWRSKVIAALGDFAQMSDGLELDLVGVQGSMRDDFTSFVVQLGDSIHGKDGGGPRTLGVFVPPSTMSPSDTPSGDAYDLAAIAAHVDRLRVMTLDYSCCNGQPGPTIESGWAIDAARFAQQSARGLPMDVAMPLYGVDFSAAGGRRPVTWLEATAVANATRASIDRVTSGAQHYTWQDESGLSHDTWFDDAASTTHVLAAWSGGALPANVGVLYYGLGAEDPALWDALARGMR